MSIPQLRHGVIDLGRGHPSLSLLATKQVAAAAATVYSKLEDFSTQEEDNKDEEDDDLRYSSRHEYGSIEYDDESRHPLQYGTDAGPRQVRETIITWLRKKYEKPAAEHGPYTRYNTHNAEANLLAITCGASVGLANTCLQMTDPLYTRRIFMITPAYFLAARIFQDAGYGDKMYAIDESAADGPDLAQLKDILDTDAQNEADFAAETKLSGKRYKYLFYGVPTFSNPSGIVWSLEKRQKMVELARAYDILLITDEVYDFLDYRKDAEILPRLVDIDRKEGTTQWGNTISNMSFSKYLGPGLRIGTIQGATKLLVDQWTSGGANHSGGAMAQHTSYYVAEMIKNGSMESVLKNLNEAYSQRANVMIEAMKANFPTGTEIYGGDGGYFIWVKLPDTHTRRKTASELLALARQDYFGVHALSGDNFEVPGHERGWGKNYFRLCLSWCPKDEALRGIWKLSQAIQQNK